MDVIVLIMYIEMSMQFLRKIQEIIDKNSCIRYNQILDTMSFKLNDNTEDVEDEKNRSNSSSGTFPIIRRY